MSDLAAIVAALAARVARLEDELAIHRLRVAYGLDGDVAEAVGYSRVYVADDGGVRVHRVSVNRWALRRTEDGWRIASRTTRLLGHAEALGILGG